MTEAEALYDMVAMRTFAGIDLGDAPMPDETTVCKKYESISAPFPAKDMIDPNALNA